MDEKRREPRYPARILARVFRRNQVVEQLTNDVSYRGVYLRTDAPPALRQLVKVELVLPKGELVGGHAMVVHLAEPTPPSGVGAGVPGRYGNGVLKTTLPRPPAKVQLPTTESPEA